MTPDTLLDRILWTQLARVVHGSPPEWDAESASARAIRAVLAETELDAAEAGILERWDEGGGSSRKLFDRLLQARVNRAVQEGARIEAQGIGLAEVPRVPKVLIVREGGLEDAGASVEARPSPKQTVVEFLSGPSADVAALEPGAKLDQLVDLLVLANQDAAESLRSSLGPSASFVREDEVPKIDLLLAAQSPSIQVFDIERELALLEEVLRNAIPAEKRPAKGGNWSFGHDLTGELLGGKYRIRGLKGKGAFKTVYEGEDEMLGARVAVAVLNPKGARSHKALEHFQDEAKKLTTLDHENIVRWITFDRSSDGLHFFVMEYLDGEELEKVLRREGRLAPKRVAAILHQCLGALRRAHTKGKHGSLLHLDLKPENVFLLPALAPGEPERVKVIDFGIGQHVGAEVRAAEHPEMRSLFDLPAEDLGKSIGSIALPEDDEPEAREPATGSSGTQLRRVQRARGGTLLYASPEQCKHLAGHKDIATLDGRSDLYSLGVMAFRMLTGQFPFARITTAFEAIQNHLEVAPRKVGSLGIKIPRDLAAFVDRCLVKEREKRWKDANEAFEALERIVHPRLSPVKVAVPLALAGALGLGALYYTSDPVVSPMTLIDPTIESVSARVVSELFLGPTSPTRTLRLESDSAWSTSDAPALRLLDATSGRALAGWSARWSAPASGAIEIALEPEARSAAAVLELDGGRRSRWRSGRIALNHLGSWRIAGVAVSGCEPGKRVDPRGQRLEVTLDGDPEGCAALATIEVWHADALVARTSVANGSASARPAHYAGPGLDTLFGEAREVELRLVARDRAGQEGASTLALQLAGEPADFGPETGFTDKSQAGAARLPAVSETLLLPENGLRLQATSAARARLFLEPASTPALALELPDPGEARTLTLQELGLAGASELDGTLRIELDDEPWVERAAPAVRTRRLAFRYTPVAPEIQVQLVAGGHEHALVEGTPDDASSAGPMNHLSASGPMRLVVRTPPGTNLWIETRAAREGDAPGDPARMARTSGPFELPLDLAEEGLHLVFVQKYLLLAGEKRGPLIPPEHVFRVAVDRTAPVVGIELEGPAGELDGEALFRCADGAGFAQRIAARVEERDLAALEWSLRLPDGSTRRGTLAAAAAAELPPLLEHQEAEGRYELELVARDRAGNAGQASRPWQVARTGPTLALLEPPVSGTDRRWAFGSNPFNVRVRASDPNGVAGVSVRVAYRGEPGLTLALTPSTADLWELPASDRPSALPWWTGNELALELTARDAAGFETPRTERGLVPDLPRTGELVIAPRERPRELMVEVQAGGEYVFGGRRGEGQRAWNVVIPRDALRSYFLDACEVTRAEYTTFLRAPDGFAEARWWPAGRASDAERAARLATEFASDPERPATGLAWEEAEAYARWRGKRLPTLLEWEFAVRGAEYREAPASVDGGPPGWPASLCTGPREWTATPERLLEGALDFASQCRSQPRALLAEFKVETVKGETGHGETGEGEIAPAAAPRPGAEAGSLARWVAGPGPGEPPSWTARSLRADEYVGFRCALAREAALSRLDRGEYKIVE